MRRPNPLPDPLLSVIIPVFNEKNTVEEIIDRHDGRPHWGKRHTKTAATLEPLYPEWGRFAAIRDRLDPNRNFSNDYVKAVLGA